MGAPSGGQHPVGWHPKGDSISRVTASHGLEAPKGAGIWVPAHLLRVDPIQGLHLLGSRRRFGLVVPIALQNASRPPK